MSIREITPTELQQLMAGDNPPSLIDVREEGEAAIGAPDNVAPVEKLLAQMQELIEQGYPLKRSDIHTGMRVLRDRPEASIVDFFTDDAVQASVRRVVTPRNVAQKMYLQSIQDNDITFGIGPAGTGKTLYAGGPAADPISA